MEAKTEYDEKLEGWRIRLPDGRLVGWYRYEHLADKAIQYGLPFWHWQSEPK
jgi:hypothetical protein